MKVIIKKDTKVDIKTLYVDAGVRYWEDTEVNGIEDEDGTLIPCRDGDSWKPIINVKTGQITNWSMGKTANVHYKVVDSGSYFLKDGQGETVLSIEDDYVPKMMCPKENGYGDYIIMDIDENGFIQNWKPTLDGFVDED